MPTTIHRSSREYLRYWVKAEVLGTKYDPTGNTVQFAFPTTGGQPATWVDGIWETADKAHFAMCLIGPTTPMVLIAGTYDVYIKITDSPEIPVRKVDRLTVT